MTLQEAAARVPSRLAKLARVGIGDGGGVTRLAFSEREAEAVLLFADWGRACGAAIVRDAFGNVFALRGDWNAEPGVMLGSHLDTVTDGGAYDGSLGVIGGLAVLESWKYEEPICVAVFRAEETTQAGLGLLGSSVFAGVRTLDEVVELLGVDLALDVDVPIQPVAHPRRYLELHIEQGPTLEQAGQMIGIVDGIAGYARWRLMIEGRAGHVGATSMVHRRDALAGAAEVILEVERLGRSKVDVASVGHLEVTPNRVGVIPARSVLTVDVRSLEDTRVDAAIASLEAIAERICLKRGLQWNARIVSRVGSVVFPGDMLSVIEAAVIAAGEQPIRLPSGANHDTSNMAKICPSGMIFVVSRDGLSHCPAEYTTPEACELGTIVLGLAARSLRQEGIR